MKCAHRLCATGALPDSNFCGEHRARMLAAPQATASAPLIVPVLLAALGAAAVALLIIILQRGLP